MDILLIQYLLCLPVWVLSLTVCRRWRRFRIKTVFLRYNFGSDEAAGDLEIWRLPGTTKRHLDQWSRFEHIAILWIETLRSGQTTPDITFLIIGLFAAITCPPNNFFCHWRSWAYQLSMNVISLKIWKAVYRKVYQYIFKDIEEIKLCMITLIWIGFWNHCI